MAPRSIRIFRSPGPSGRLLLHDGGGLWDLSDLLQRQGQPTDLVDLFEADYLTSGRLEKLLPGGGIEWRPADVETDANGVPVELDVPIAPRRVGKILALGKNFRAHAEEFGEAPPEEPLFFNKLPETLCPHDATVVIPPWLESRVDHEAELAVVVGLGGRDIAAEDAMDHVAGYTVANDLTARTIQGEDLSKKYPWFRAKNLDGFCPLGPCFVPRDFLDLSDLRVTCEVGGELRQDASTRDWIVDLPAAIVALSRHLTLHPGDLILMGTPAGVGPLVDGDRVRCKVEGIGILDTHISRPSP